MKILHAITSLDPASGGPPLVALGLAAAQAKLGHEVFTASHASDDARPRIEKLLKTVPGADAIKHTIIPAPDRYERLMAARAAKMFDEVLPGMDFVQTHAVWEPFSHVCGKKCFQLGIPYAATPHGMFDIWAMSRSTLKKKFSLAWGGQRYLDQAAFVHLLNEQERQRCRQPFKAPVEIVGNGIFPEEIDPLPARGTFRALMAAKGETRLGEKPYVLFLSRLHYKKGLDYLAEGFVELAKMLPDVMLVAAGPEEGSGDDFRQRIAAAGLNDRVIVPGGLYGKDKYAAIVDSALFCLPSRQEGFSMAILEAMACQRPVVISPACNFPEVQSSGAGAVVEPDNAAALAAAMAQFVQNPQAGDTAGRLGRELVYSKYTWHEIARQMTDIYGKYTTKK